MTKITQFIRLAYERGYRVTDDGVLLGFQGHPISLTYRKNNKYPTFTVYVGKSHSKDGYWKIPVHRFAAYCFYGEETFNHSLVRHLNANLSDIRKTNIALGNAYENAMDRTPESRKSSSIQASKTFKLSGKTRASSQKLCKISYCQYGPCGKVFDITRDNRSNRPRKHCSRSCAAKNRRNYGL